MVRINRIGLYAANLVGILVLITFAGQSLLAQSSVKKPIHQLRIYDIPKANEKAFHERFRDHAQRIMKKYDFRIVAMWRSETGERSEFIYLLEWADRKTMQESWARFMADEEWIEIKKRTSAIHGVFVNSIQEKTLELTDYSSVPKVGRLR